MTRKQTEAIDPIEQLDQSLTFLQEQRTQQLLTAYRYQTVDQRALERERTRLSQKYGDDHPRVLAMTTRLASNDTLFNALDQEIVRSENRQEPLPEGSWRVRGQVFDAADKPLPRQTVYLASARHEAQASLGYACTDEGGQYAITLNAEQVRKYQDQPLVLTVTDVDKTVVYRADEPLRPVADAVDLRTIHIGGKQEHCDNPFDKQEDNRLEGNEQQPPEV